MKILIADRLSSPAINRLQDLAHELEIKPELTQSELAVEIEGHDVLVVRSTEVTAEVIGAGDRLSLIVRAGAGTDSIDTDFAASEGVYVSNVPGKNSIAVAELTLGLILAIDRNIPANVADIRDGRWNKKLYSKTRGLFGRTIGIIGLGDVGLAVAERAAALGMKVIARERSDRPPEVLQRAADVPVAYVSNLLDLAKEADIVSLHLPLRSETTAMIGRTFLSQMQKGAILINTSRGDLVDEEALLAILDQGWIRYGADVFADEPPGDEGSFESSLAQHRNVYATHHIGASTEQAQEAIADEVVRIIDAFAAGRIVNCVNLEERRTGMATLTVRHYDRVGVLSEVFRVLRNADINVGQMENRVFRGAIAAVATMQVSGSVEAGVRRDLEALENVLAVTVVEAPQSRANRTR